MNPLCKLLGHKWGEWGFSFEPGDGSYAWQHSCVRKECNWAQYTTKEPDGAKIQKRARIWTEMRHLLVQALTELILWIVPKDACGDAIIKHTLAMSKDVVKIMELEDERDNRTRLNPNN